MQNKVFSAIEKYNMLKAGEPVLVGLSGGADSVSLSLCLKRLGYKVSAVHINHCLRGEESDRDEQFCRCFCQENGIELVVCRVDVNAYCFENKLSSELGARQLRYKLFSDTLNKLGILKLATAHNLSDCLETTILNLVRGCSVKGICGIPPVRDNIIRPLIDCTRDEIEAYLSENNQEYVTDSTNLVDDCSRNIIRLNVIPQLLRINSGIFKSYESTLDNFRATSEYIAEKALELATNATVSENRYRTEVLLSEKQPIIGTCLSRLLALHGVEPSSDKIDRMIDICKNDGKITLTKDIYAESKNGFLSFRKENTATGQVLQELQYDVPVTILGKTIELQKVCVAQNNNNVHKKFTKNIIDCDKIKGVLVVRNRRSGDRIKLAGRNITSSVKTLFNANVPLDKRDKVVFVADDDGVVFIEGFGVAQRVAPDGDSENIARVKVCSCH